QRTQTIYLSVFAILVGSITIILKSLSIALFSFNRELRNKYILFMALDFVRRCLISVSTPSPPPSYSI
ncbi:hypothetical protein PENTCL1PPCAC_14406, partial [Pristionchus entomophagus]